jgi:inosose dehydratase
VMVEPPKGVPDLAPIIEAVSDIAPDIFAIVEQDMFPVESIDLPLGIATRTREHIVSCSRRVRTH